MDMAVGLPGKRRRGWPIDGDGSKTPRRYDKCEMTTDMKTEGWKRLRRLHTHNDVEMVSKGETWITSLDISPGPCMCLPIIIHRKAHVQTKYLQNFPKHLHGKSSSKAETIALGA